MISFRYFALALALLYATMQAGSYVPVSSTDNMAHALNSQSAKSTQAWDLLKPPKGAGGLAGLYWGSKLENTYSAFGGMTLNAIRLYIVFLPNGQYFSALPFDGRISDLDFAEFASKSPKLCGFYRLQGNNIIIQRLSPSNQIVEITLPFRRIDANHILFSWQGAPMRRAEPVHDLHLNGFYTTTKLVNAGNVNVTTDTYIEFSPDGRYRQSGFISVVPTSPTTSPKVLTSKRGPQTGRYKIEGFRLTLTPDNEPPQYFTIVLEDTSTVTKGLFINNRAFLKN
ncbi:MAG: hypothetical protein J2P21_15540 [Chloracidobacterium sp.]|nr:hypothetical protein [Chloracidobacterium sp.]